MVAIFTGLGSGLNRSSSFVLGGRGELGQAGLGRAGEQAYVNAATGNLTLERADEILIGRGPDQGLGLTYDSIGPSWAASWLRGLYGLTGTVNTAGSTITRAGEHRDTTVFTYDSGRSAYVSKEGAGAYDEVKYAGGTWSFKDGDSQVVEYYEHVYAAGVFVRSSSVDPDGNAQTFTFNANHDVTRITNADGGYTEMSYTVAGRPDEIRTYATGGPSATLTRVHYTWDSSGRVERITVDLTPENGSIADSQTYVINYGYAGTSNRVNLITQSDGSRLDIEYDGSNRVSILTETVATGVTRTTTFGYNSGNTTVTRDGLDTTLVYDAQGRLTQLTLPAPVAGGAAQVLGFGYNANGDVTSATDAAGNVTTYEYDLNGNQTLRRDALGNSVVRKYGSNNQLLIETAYAVADPDGGGGGLPTVPLTTRYAYDSENHLRYAVSAEGRVTEYRYDRYGNQVSKIDYTRNVYDVSGLGVATEISESSVNSWVSALADRGATSRTDTFYDLRGNVSRTVSYASVSLFGETASSPLAVTPGANTTVAQQPDGLYRVTKTSGGAAAWDADAFSSVKTDGDFVLRIRAVQANGHVITGVTSVPAGSASWDNAQYGVQFLDDGNARIIEAGSVKTASAGYAAGDNYWLVRTGSTIAYYKGATLAAATAAGAFYTSLTAASGTYYADSAICSPGASVDVEFTPLEIVNGSGTTVSAQPDGFYRITKTSATNGNWEASARSTVKADGDFVLHLRPGQTDKDLMAGISAAPGVSTSYTDLSHGLWFMGDGQLYYVEKDSGGTTVYSSLGTSYAATDHFWLVRTGTTVKYYRGATLDAAVAAGPLRTSAFASSGAAYFDSSFVVSGGSVDVAFNPAPIVNGAGTSVLQQSDGLYRIAKTGASDDWDSDGRSTMRADGDFVLRLRPVATGKHYIGGVSAMPGASSSYTNVQYGFYFQPDGTASVHAAGVSKSTTYVAGDNFWVVRTGTTINYHKGATLEAAVAAGSLHSSEGAAGAFHFDSSLRSAGASMDVGFTGSDVTQTDYVYDPAGNLVKRIASGTGAAEVFVYDGLGRVTSSTDFNGQTTSIAFNDSSGTTVLTLSNGLTKTSTYNKIGELIAYAEAGSGVATATTGYAYDSLGRLRFTTDATGLRTHILYDRVGRKVADIDADGSVVEYGYNSNDLVNRTIRYSEKLSIQQLASLVDGNGNPAAVTIESLRPAPKDADRWTWNIYDSANRLVQTIDGVGATTIYSYDAASRLLSTTAYANLIASGTLSTFKTAAPATLQLPAGDAANDRIVRSFYDKDGLLVGTLDAEGFLTHNIYDKAGRKTQSISYASATATVLRARGSFVELLSSVTPGTATDIVPNPVLADGTGGWTLSNAERIAGSANDPLPFLFRTVSAAGAGAASTGLFTLPPGDRFKLSYWVKPGTAGQQFQAAIYWYDSAGAFITAASFDRFPTDTANFTTYDLLVARPANAVYGSVYGLAVGGAIGQWTAPRLVVDNMLPNAQPGDTAAWTISNAAWVAGGTGAPAPYIFQAGATGNGSVTTGLVPAPDVTALDISYAIKPGVAGQQFQTYIAWYDINGGPHSVAAFENFYVGNTSVFTTYQYQVTKPAGAAFYYISTLAVGGAGAQWGNYRVAPANTAATSVNPKDIRSHFVYDGRGLLIGAVDGEGGVTRYHHNAFGDVDRAVSGQKMDPAAILRVPPTAATLLTAPGSNLETTGYTRNQYGQVLTETRSIGGGATTTTAYQYDSGRRLTGTTSQSGGSDPRTAMQRYDKRGRLIGELSGSGSAALAALGSSPTQTQIDAVWATYGISYAYDGADRLISTTEPQGVNPAAGRTLYYYTVDGDLAFTVGALGEVVEYRYDALGQRTDTIQYANRIGSTTLAGMTGGIVTTGVATIMSGLPDAARDGATHVDYNVTGTVSRSRDSLSSVTTYDYNAFRETTAVVEALGSPVNAVVADFSFEAPEVGTSFAYQPMVTGMTFSAGAGVAANGSAWNFAAAPDGDQVAFMHAGNTISQTVTGLSSGSLYSLSFSLAQRSGFSVAGVTVAFDGVVLGTYGPGSTAFTQFTTPIFQAGAGSGTITFTSTGPDGNYCVGLDQVLLTSQVKTAHVYDRRGLLVGETRDAAAGGLNLATSYGYDAFGRTVQSIDPKNHLSKWAYDRAGRVTGTTDALNQSDSFTYDALGNMVSSTDVAGKVTRYVYEGSRLIWSVDPEGGVVKRSYDADGRVVATRAFATALSSSVMAAMPLAISEAAITPTLVAVDLKDEVTRFAYDKDGQLRFTVDGLSHLHETVRDASGNVIRTIDYDGTIQVGATWTAADLQARIVPDGLVAARVARAVYDAGNRVAFAIDAAGTVTAFTYDSAGNVTRQKTYFTLYTASGDPLLSAMQSWAVTNDANADNRIGRSFYDRKGQLAYAMDALGYVTEYRYDKIGHVAKQIRYQDAPAGVTDTTTTAQLAALIGTPTTARTTSFGYDGAGRLVDVWDAMDVRTHMVLDELGRATQTVAAYGTADSSTTLRAYDALGRVTSETRANGASEATTTFFLYDALGRATDVTQGYGTGDASTTHFVYDSLGRVKSETRGWGTLEASARSFGYDALGNMLTETDGRGAMTVRTYDSMGRVLTVAEPLKTGAVTGSNLLTNGSFEQSGSYVDTGYGRLSSTLPGWTRTNALGYQQVISGIEGVAATDGTYWLDLDSTGGAGSNMEISQTVSGRTAGEILILQFDHASAWAAATSAFEIWWNGALVATISETGTNMRTKSFELFAVAGNNVLTFKGIGAEDAYGAELDNVRLFATQSPETAVTTNVYDVFGNVVKVTDPRGNPGYFYYDALNRLTLQVDPEGYATSTAYTLGGEVKSVTRFAEKVSGTYSESVKPADPTGVKAITLFDRDKLDRVTGVTDAEGYAETYLVNGFGERTSATREIDRAPLTPRSATTTYTYDKLGRLLTETLPVSAIRTDGTVQPGDVVNKFEYDLRGNRTKTIEAFGLTEARTTIFVYDKLDRAIEKRGDPVQIVALDLATTSTITPTEYFHYDRRGNLVESKDAAGARTLAYYDDLDRKIVELSPVGTFSSFDYDRNSNLVASRVYGTAVSPLPTTPGGTPPSPPSGEVRETTQSYDWANRLTATSVAGLRTGAWNGSTYAMSVGAVTTGLEYDRNGNVVIATDGNGNKTYSFYDKLNRKTAQVDQENYLTAWTLDGNGNAISERRYKTAATWTPSAAAPPTVTPHSDDRVTAFTYDRNGRRRTEERAGVAIHGIDPSSGAVTASNVTAIIKYEYNGLGLVTRKEEANGDITDFEYDNIGRLLRTKAPQFTDYSGATVMPLAENFHDGLGNVVRTELNKLGGSSADDRVTIFNYGAGGRLSSTTDAANFTRTYGYDAAGRVVKESYTRLKSDGTTNVTEAIAYRYDLAGRLVTQAMASLSGSTWTFGDAARMRYNAYGEVTGKGITGGPDVTAVYQEVMDYDSGGRLWRSNAGDGVLRFHVYDKAGNETLTLASTGADLSAAGLNLTLANYTDSITSTGDTSLANAVTTVTAYDKRGQSTSTREPDRQLSASSTATIVRARTYNAFGEVLSEIDPRGFDSSGNALSTIASFTTTFTYNAMGRLLSKVSPLVSVTSESAIVSTANPTEYYGYDKSGRLVSIQDGNGNVTKRLLLAGTGHGGGEALVTKEFHPDTGVVATGYDVFGDARIVRNALFTGSNSAASDEALSYDKMGRVTSIARRGGLLTDYYTYDGLGQRTRHWNSQLGTTNVESTDYDRQGRITSQVAFGGDSTAISYAWSATIDTTGLGTFGGWTQTTTYANSKTLVEQSDMFGHAVARTDLGAHGFTFTYDRGGRLTQRGGAETLDRTYFNTGLEATLTAGSGNQSSYAYDSAGNRISEYTVRGSSVIQNATASWDALGRMTAWAEAGSSAMPASSMTWEYDLVGNIRHSYSTYYQLNDQGTVLTTPLHKDHWYRYDSMNRLVGENGNTYLYDKAGQRKQRYYVEYVTRQVLVDEAHQTYITRHQYLDRREDYDYRADGALSTVTLTHQEWNEYTLVVSAGTARLAANYTYDAMGRLTRQVDWLGNGTSVGYDHYDIVYNDKGQVTSEKVATRRFNSGTNQMDTYVDTTSNNYGSGTSYALGATVYSTTSTARNGNFQIASRIDNTFAWYDGAQQSTIVYDSDTNSFSNTVRNTSFTYGGSGQVASIYVADGVPHSIAFTNDLNGLALRRDETDYNPGTSNPNLNTGDPHEIWYRYNGKEMGYVGNNGTLDTDYQTSQYDRAIPGTGYGGFRGGSSAGTAYADFDLSLDPITSYFQGSAGGSYTVRAGETLQSIAQNVWGDSSLWYKIAEANGMSGPAALGEGQRIRLPAGVMKSGHSASTFKPYDAAQVLGDVSPTTPKPAKNASNCGMMGQIMLVAIAVAITAFLQPELAPLVAKLGAGTILAGAAAGAVAAAAGSIVSQGVGVATGIQQKFDWKGVGMAAISGAIGGGLSGLGKLAEANKIVGTLGKVGKFLARDGFISGAVRGATTNVLTQGVAITTGLQRKFDWTGVAASAAVGGVMGEIRKGLPDITKHNFAYYQQQAYTSAAGALVGAATRTLIDGTDFGDNIMASLPDVIGQTIGGLVADQFVAHRGPAPIAQPGSDEGWIGPVGGGLPMTNHNDFSERLNRYWVQPEDQLIGGESYSSANMVQAEEIDIVVTAPERTELELALAGADTFMRNVGESMIANPVWGLVKSQIESFPANSPTNYLLTRSATALRAMGLTRAADLTDRGAAIIRGVSGGLFKLGVGGVDSTVALAAAPVKFLYNGVTRPVATLNAVDRVFRADGVDVVRLGSSLKQSIRQDIADLRSNDLSRVERGASGLTVKGGTAALVAVPFAPKTLLGGLGLEAAGAGGFVATAGRARAAQILRAASTETTTTRSAAARLAVNGPAAATRVETVVATANASARVEAATASARAVASAAAIHPGRLAAEGASVAPESVVRALRQAGTPESLATAKLISTGRLDMRMMAADPSGRGLGGLYRFGTREIELYSNAYSTPRQAAGFATHETTHFMQGLTPRNYNLGHEFDAFRAQGRVDLGHWTNGLSDNGLYNTLQTHPVYRGVPADPRWPR